ncbi:MAG TPA: TolC family protein [Chitinophagaceae bacterium]
MKKLLSIFFFIHVAVISFAQSVPSQSGKNNLDYFIQNAIANSPLLKDYESQLSSLSLDSKIFLASLKPQVNGISNNSYAPVIGGWGYDNVITNGQQLSALVSANKSLLNKKSITSQLENLRIQGQSATNSIRISEQDIKKVVADQYITVFGEQLQLDYNNRVNNMLLKEDSILKKLTQDNVYKQSDYLAFVVTRQQQLLSTSQLQTQYYFDYAGLNYLAGIVDTAITPLPDPQLLSATVGDFASSLFYKQFELDSLKLANDRALVDANYRAKINLFADAGYNSSLVYKPYKNLGTSIGVNISIPIYDGRQRKMQYSKIDIQERSRLFKKDFFARQRRQQLLQLIQQLNSTEQLIDQINKQIKYTETLITVNEKLLATGDIRLTDFILSLNNYFTAKNLLTQNYITRLKIINQLNYWGK